VQVVADAGPLHYLVLIGQIDLLPRLFATVTVPKVVRDELLHTNTPQAGARLGVRPAALAHGRDSPGPRRAAPQRLGAGESAAITLTLALQADLMLMDDRVAVAVARAQGLAVAGTIGILDLAGRRKLIDIVDAVARLKATNFRYRPSLLDALLTGRGDKGGA
jgi:predicted nucleic acid-binding protein